MGSDHHKDFLAEVWKAVKETQDGETPASVCEPGLLPSRDIPASVPTKLSSLLWLGGWWETPWPALKKHQKVNRETL